MVTLVGVRCLLKWSDWLWQLLQDYPLVIKSMRIFIRDVNADFLD